MTVGRRLRLGVALATSVVAFITGRALAGSAGAGDSRAQGLTVLYQNFPNPFPSSTSQTTCLWFDLAVPTDVTLAVYDIRGRLVRTLIPSPQMGGALSAGSYGRQVQGTNAGCDPRFAWDGRASDGRTVPPGVYLARLHADGRWQTKKMVFRGP